MKDSYAGHSSREKRRFPRGMKRMNGIFASSMFDVESFLGYGVAGNEPSTKLYGFLHDKESGCSIFWIVD